MKTKSNVKIFLSFVCVSIWLIAGVSSALGQAPGDRLEVNDNPEFSNRPVFVPTPPDEPVERYVTIDFENVDVNLFIKYISELTGKNFIIDKAVRGNVTIVSPTKISIEEAYKVFESVLEVQGFTTVPAGSITKILPAVDARSKSVTTAFKDCTSEFNFLFFLLEKQSSLLL